MMDQLGHKRGVDYDILELDLDGLDLPWITDPQRFSSGLGFVESGDADGYETVVTFLGERKPGSINPSAFESWIAALRSWGDLSGDRHRVFFGSKWAAALASATSATADFLTTSLGVDWLADDLLDFVNANDSYRILPTLASFTKEFSVMAPCEVKQMDRIQPAGGASAGHRFEQEGASGTPDLGAAASVIFDRLVGADRKLDVCLPFPFWGVVTPNHKDGTGVSERALLLEEILESLIGGPGGSGPATDVTPDRPLLDAVVVQPNPFNPATEIRFELGRVTEVRARVYDLRGRRVVTLLEGRLEPGPQSIRWDGTDDGRRAVASGVYVVQVEAGDRVARKKVALVK
jgi:hypothetical protein